MRSTSQTRLFAGLTGLTSGTLGSLNGVAGSIINIPILTSVFKLTQHQAHGTTAVAALASSFIGSYSFYKSGGGYKSVDVPAAATIGIVAMSISPIGVAIGQKLSQKSLLYILSGLLFCVPPLILKKQELLNRGSVVPAIHYSANDDTSTTKIQSNNTEILNNNNNNKINPIDQPNSLLYGPTKDKIALALMGVLSGITGGIFGVGGGVVLVPLFSLYSTSHQNAIGTSLCAMIPPLVMSAIFHKRAGNVASLNILAPLIIGSGTGAFLGSRFAMNLNDETQRAFFCVLMLTMAFRNLYSARKISQVILQK